MTTYTQINYDISETIARITLNRPEKRNALSDTLISELRSALRAAETNPEVRVIVLRGAGKDFCAGADLAQLEKISQASILENLEDASQLAELFLLLRQLKKPVMAAVQGRAFAGGAGLASACDLVIASRSAQFCYTEVKLGFVAAMVMAITRRNLSEKRAFELLTTARVFGAEEALNFGFINRLCEETELESETEKFAHEVARNSASAVMLTKQLLYQMDAMTFAQAIRAGVEINALARLTPDCQQGVKGFLQKQK